MKWRPINRAELTECLAIEPRHFGDEIIGRDGALAVWNGWVQHRGFTSSVLIDDSKGASERIVGFGAGVFITRDFADEELAHPRPGLNGRLVASTTNGNSAVRATASLEDTGEANALDAVILAGSFRPEGLSDAQRAEAQMLLPSSFGEQHIGYRLGRILMETVTPEQRLFHESSGVWETVRVFDGGERALIQLTRTTATRASGSLAAALFVYRPPVLDLRPTDKELLSEALDGATDNELATRLNISLGSVKKRWGKLFERVADTRPDLLPDARIAEGSDGRGTQKRHRVLAYVRTHPEEIRPYRWRMS